MVEINTRSGGTTKLSDEVLGEFAMAHKGDAVPGRFQGERGAFNGMHPGNPAFTVRPEGLGDVVAAVNLAREHDLDFTVRGGGHSIAGLSSIDGGMLIDLELMRGVHVDPAAKLAHVQGGAVWADVDRATSLFGLAAPGGVVSDTGVVGLTLGGGYGWLRRSHGLACDNVIAAQVVTADGQVVTASADENPDLYWALRGGGGNFGVVTSLTFQLHDVGPIVGFSATFYPMAELRSILSKWKDYVEDLPNEITSVVVTATFPEDPHMPEPVQGADVVIVGGVYTGDPEAGLAAMAPLRELGTPLFDMSGPTPWVAVQSGFDGLFPRLGLNSYWKAQYADELSDGLMDVITSYANDRPAPLTMVNTFIMGGAIADVDPEATAFAQRSSKYLVSIDGNWTDASMDDAGVAWVRRCFDAVTPYGTGDIYLNFTGRSDEAAQDGVDDALGRNMARLRQVKATYDPTNMFRHNNNIIPA